MNFTELLPQLRIPFCEIKSTSLARQPASFFEHERFLMGDQFRVTLASKVLHQLKNAFYRFLIHIHKRILATLSFAHDSPIVRFIGVVRLEAVCLENPIDASRQTFVRNVRSISPECVEMIVRKNSLPCSQCLNLDAVLVEIDNIKRIMSYFCNQVLANSKKLSPRLHGDVSSRIALRSAAEPHILVGLKPIRDDKFIWLVRAAETAPSIH